MEVPTGQPDALAISSGWLVLFIAPFQSPSSKLGIEVPRSNRMPGAAGLLKVQVKPDDEGKTRTAFGVVPNALLHLSHRI